MYLVTVLPLSKKARTDVLSYFHGADIPLGTLVEVPFRNKPMHAIVTETRLVEDMKSMIKGASYQLRKVSKVLGDSAFPKEVFTSIQELSDFYVAPFGNVIDDVIPEFLFEEIVQAQSIPPVGITPVPSLFVGDTEDRMSWYKTRIRELFAQKKSIFIAAPTEREAKNMHAALSRGIEEYCVLITSGLPKKKLGSTLHKIKTEEHPLCIFGTPAFVALPRADLDTIVVEHESSQNYRRITHPYIDMRFFVEIYARARKLSLIFSDTLPRVETYQRFVSGELTEVRTITFHPSLPEREVIIPREKKTERSTFRMISEELEAEIARIQKNGGRSFIFALRNGIASMTACRDCSEVLSCEFCNAPLALYKTGEKRVFICNACKRHAPNDSACRRCGSWNLHSYGVGIESVYEECVARFPEAQIFRIDRATIKNDKEARTMMENFETSAGGILVGTELALNYITAKVPLIGVASFDSLFSIPSFRVSERIVELVTTLREKTEKLLMIQTIYPDDRLLSITAKPRLFSWYAEELAERQDFNYPPFCTLIKIVGHFPKDKINQARESLATELAVWTPDIFTGNSAENKNYAKLVALIKLPKSDWWFPHLGKNKQNADLKKVLTSLRQNYAVLVNPEDLL